MPSINVDFAEEEFETLLGCKPEGYTWKRFMLASCWLMGRRADKPRKEWEESWKLDPAEEITKPCHDCGFCPFGQLVEVFPFSDDFRCTVFGHDCPAFWLAEPIAE